MRMHAYELSDQFRPKSHANTPTTQANTKKQADYRTAFIMVHYSLKKQSLHPSDDICVGTEREIKNKFYRWHNSIG